MTKRLVGALVVAVLAVGALAAPASARWDSGWPCGGACRVSSR